MPVYEYRCTADDHTYEYTDIHSIAEHDDYTPPDCPFCGNRFKPLYGNVQIGRVVHGEYNPTVGKIVAGEKQFTQALKEHEDKMSERLGFDQKYGVADPTDRKHLGVTEKGIESHA